MESIITGNVECNDLVKIGVECSIDSCWLPYVQANQNHTFRKEEVVVGPYTGPGDKPTVYINSSVFTNHESVMGSTTDGSTHLNVYSAGKTLVGRFATNFATARFTHPEFGDFVCVEGFWHWYATGMQHEIYRYHRGSACKVIAKWHTKVPVTDFEARVREAINAKYKAHPEQLAALMATDLPLVHYYEYGGKVVVPKHNHWVISHLMDIRDGKAQL